MVDNEKDYIGSLHTTEFLKPKRLKHYIKNAIKVLRKLNLKYDTIAFCGISGAIIGPPIAILLNKELILVRKLSDVRNTSYDVAGFEGCKKYI